MSKVELTQEEYDSMIYRLATLEAENQNHLTLLEAPAKKLGPWWRLWEKGAKAAVVALVLVLVGVGGGVGGSALTYFTGNFYLKQPDSVKPGLCRRNRWKSV